MICVLHLHWTEPSVPGMQWRMWATVPEPYHALDLPDWFDHHERGHNRTMKFNCSPTMDY